MKAWLIFPRHPDPQKKRSLTRRVAGRWYRFDRLPIAVVSVVMQPRISRDGSIDERPMHAGEWVRVRFRNGSETWALRDRLASNRQRFLPRWIALSGAIGVDPSASGDAALPAMTGSIDGPAPIARSSGEPMTHARG